MIVEATSELMEKFDKYAKEPSKPVDVFPDFALLTLDAICRCAFGFVSKPPPPKNRFWGETFWGGKEAEGWWWLLALLCVL